MLMSVVALLSYFCSRSQFLSNPVTFCLSTNSLVDPLLPSLCPWTVHSASSPPATLLVTPHFFQPSPLSGPLSSLGAFDGHPPSLQWLPLLFLGGKWPHHPQYPLGWKLSHPGVQGRPPVSPNAPIYPSPSPPPGRSRQISRSPPQPTGS